MRILHAIQELSVGGAEHVVLTLVRASRDAGNDVAVAAAPGPLGTMIADTVHPLPFVERRLSRVPRAALALDRAVRSARPHLLHAHNPGMAAVAALATIRGRRLRGLVTVHGVEDEHYREAARLLRLAGLPVVACGPGVASGLKEHDLDVAATIVNGIAPAPPPTSRERLFAELGVPVEAPLVVSVGRLAPLKNHALVVGSLTDVPAATLLLVGDGPLGTDLASLADRLGVRDRVVFAGYRADARSLMGAADVVVLPSKSEGLPLVALEAMAAGKPLVTTDIRGVRELVHDGANGLVVPPGDPQALASAISRVLEDERLRSDLRRGALQTARLYTDEAMVAGYLDLYAKLAGRPARSSTAP